MWKQIKKFFFHSKIMDTYLRIRAFWNGEYKTYTQKPSSERITSWFNFVSVSTDKLLVVLSKKRCFKKSECVSFYVFLQNQIKSNIIFTPDVMTLTSKIFVAFVLPLSLINISGSFHTYISIFVGLSEINIHFFALSCFIIVPVIKSTWNTTHTHICINF